MFLYSNLMIIDRKDPWTEYPAFLSHIQLPFDDEDAIFSAKSEHDQLVLFFNVPLTSKRIEGPLSLFVPAESYPALPELQGYFRILGTENCVKLHNFSFPNALTFKIALSLLDDFYLEELKSFKERPDFDALNFTSYVDPYIHSTFKSYLASTRLFSETKKVITRQIFDALPPTNPAQTLFSNRFCPEYIKEPIRMVDQGVQTENFSTGLFNPVNTTISAPSTPMNLPMISNPFNFPKITPYSGMGSSGFYSASSAPFGLVNSISFGANTVPFGTSSTTGGINTNPFGSFTPNFKIEEKKEFKFGK